MSKFLTLHSYNPFIFLPNSSPKSPFYSSFSNRTTFTVFCTHSNPNIIKTNRRLIYGKPLSPYDSDDEMYQEEDDDDDDDDDDFFSDEEFAESADFDAKDKKSKTLAGGKLVNNGQSSKLSKSRRIAYLQQNKSPKFGRSSVGERYPELSEQIDLDVKWLPLLDYLSTFGISESQLVQIYGKHKSAFQVNVSSAREKLDYLMSLGVKHKDIKRILLRQPQIIGVEKSLKPTVRYLVEEVGINEKILGKVIQLSPRVLVQSIDISWNTRLLFFTKELGASKESIVKMVTKHPQLLHYSIDDGLLPRINFLRSIGMKNADILKILTSLTQVLSLSLEANLKPKYLYLVNELHNEAQSLTKYPMYLSLSLEQRIRPRHRFLVLLKKAPKGPFPLGSLIPTDESFCQKWAGTTLDKYMAFRQRSSLKNLAEKYKRKM
ncbi:unnamed protein product [Vicia faba]|uniref:Transcription termination factor MTERF9, chloroplastic n=1 Tax=Vicia faba TaxID=3906 RepID=A0AAV0YM91_VICFA|nr:unnamed protein product [Vicia faba]